jgi:hypothetical protein
MLRLCLTICCLAEPLCKSRIVQDPGLQLEALDATSEIVEHEHHVDADDDEDDIEDAEDPGKIGEDDDGDTSVLEVQKQPTVDASSEGSKSVKRRAPKKTVSKSLNDAVRGKDSGLRDGDTGKGDGDGAGGDVVKGDGHSDGGDPSRGDGHGDGHGTVGDGLLTAGNGMGAGCGAGGDYRMGDGRSNGEDWGMGYGPVAGGDSENFLVCDLKIPCTYTDRLEQKSLTTLTDEEWEMYKDTPPDQCPPRIRDLIVLDPRTWNFTDSFNVSGNAFNLSNENLFDRALSRVSGPPHFQSSPLSTFASGNFAQLDAQGQYGHSLNYHPQGQYGHSLIYHPQNELLPDRQPTDRQPTGSPSLLVHSLHQRNHELHWNHRTVMPRPIFNKHKFSAGGVPYTSEGSTPNGSDTAEGDRIPCTSDDSNNMGGHATKDDLIPCTSDDSINKGGHAAKDDRIPYASDDGIRKDGDLPDDDQHHDGNTDNPQKGHLTGGKGKLLSILGPSPPINSGSAQPTTEQSRMQTRGTKTRANGQGKENAPNALGKADGMSTRGQRKRKVEAMSMGAGGGGKRASKRTKASG